MNEDQTYEIDVGNLAWLVPISFIGAKFEEPVLGFLFGLIMMIVTLRLFPLVTIVKADQNKKKPD